MLTKEMAIYINNQLVLFDIGNFPSTFYIIMHGEVNLQREMSIQKFN
jgi:hypothetical protein